MARSQVVFLNCYNLFAAGRHKDRGPQSVSELDAKIGDLAVTISKASMGAPPDIVCLCEVGEETLGKRVAEAIAANYYRTLWSGVTDVVQTGLMICYNPNIFQYNIVADDSSAREAGSRCKWFTVLFRSGTTKMSNDYTAILNELPQPSATSPAIDELKRFCQGITAYCAGKGTCALERGYLVQFGQEFQVTLIRADNKYKLILMRAYVPAQDTPVRLDTYEENLIQCNDIEELKRELKKFLRSDITRNQIEEWIR